MYLGHNEAVGSLHCERSCAGPPELVLLLGLGTDAFVQDVQDVSMGADQIDSRTAARLG